MNKLSKEQADWLIQQFKFKAASASHLYNSEIDQVINQCTEKEFPSIHMRPAHATDEEKIEVDYVHCDNATDKTEYCIRLFSFEEYTHFSKEEFREFVLKCNTIIGYLDAET